MANKTVQLTNEDGDNLYPLAGGMAADSITTAMVQDGAVTSDKIDWTTPAYLSLVTGLNDSVSWSGGGDTVLLSGTITLSKNSRLYINGTTVMLLTGMGARLSINVDGSSVQNTIYTSVHGDYVTLTAQLMLALTAGTHTVSLVVRPDNDASAGGTARCYSLVAFEA